MRVRYGYRRIHTCGRAGWSTTNEFIGSIAWEARRYATSRSCRSHCNEERPSLWMAGKLPNKISGQIRGLPEGLVTQVGVPLGHGRAFVGQELLQGIKVHLAG